MMANTWQGQFPWQNLRTDGYEGTSPATPNEDERARVAGTLGSLQALRSAMDAERTPGGASAAQGEVVRGRLFGFDAALRGLRPPDTSPA
jgi:hypothetical protein